MSVRNPKGFGMKHLFVRACICDITQKLLGGFYSICSTFVSCTKCEVEYTFDVIPTIIFKVMGIYRFFHKRSS